MRILHCTKIAFWPLHPQSTNNFSPPAAEIEGYPIHDLLCTSDAQIVSKHDDKKLRKRLLAKQLQQKLRIKARFVKTGISNDVIRRVLEKDIDRDQLKNLLLTLPKSLASTVENWCDIFAAEKIASSDSRNSIYSRTADRSVVNGRVQERGQLETSESAPPKKTSSQEKTAIRQRKKKHALKKKLERHGVNSEVADEILKSLNNDLVSTHVPNSLTEEVLLFIAESHSHLENSLRRRLSAENVDPVSMDCVLKRTVSKTTISAVLECVSMTLARMICRWLGDDFAPLIRWKQQTQNAAKERRRYTTSTYHRSTKQTRVSERLKSVSALLRNRVLARQSMDRRLLNKQVRERNRERARVRARNHPRSWLDKTVPESVEDKAPCKSSNHCQQTTFK